MLEILSMGSLPPFSTGSDFATIHRMGEAMWVYHKHREAERFTEKKTVIFLLENGDFLPKYGGKDEGNHQGRDEEVFFVCASTIELEKQ